MKLQLVGGPCCGRLEQKGKETTLQIFNDTFNTVETYELNFNKYTKEEVYLYSNTKFLPAVPSDTDVLE